MIDLAFVILLVSINIIIIWKNFEYTNPGKLFVAYWIMNIAAAVILFNCNVSWKFSGIIYLIFCVDIFFVISNLIIKKIGKKRGKYTNWGRKTNEIQTLLIICFICGLVYNFLELTNNGFGINTLLSFEGLNKVGDYFTNGRYTDSVTIVVTGIEQICLTVAYSGNLLAGFMIKNRKYIQIISPVLCMIYSTAKTPFICALILWLCGYFLSVITYAKITKISNRMLFKLIFLAIVAYLLLFISFINRYDGNSASYIFNRIIVYAIGHVPAFGEWFDVYEGSAWGFGHGRMIFSGIMGTPSDYLRDYLKARCYSIRYETPYSWTNVITLFAYVIMDFGYLGSIIFWGVFGIVTSLLYVEVVSKENSFAMGLLGLCYFELLYSFLVSALKYKSIIGAFLLFSLYIWTVKNIKLKGVIDE